MDKKLIAKVSATINAPIAKAWDALVTPELIKRYFFGTTVVSDWKEGSSITWNGEWQGKTYQDKGVILRHDPKQMLRYTHFSPLSGLPDKPENYHTVTIDLVKQGDQTLVTLTQDNNPSEEAKQHSEKNWGMMLAGLKKLLEK